MVSFIDNLSLCCDFNENKTHDYDVLFMLLFIADAHKHLASDVSKLSLADGHKKGKKITKDEIEQFRKEAYKRHNELRKRHGSDR